MSSDMEDAPKIEFDTWGEATCFKGTSYANGKDFITTERWAVILFPASTGVFSALNYVTASPRVRWLSCCG